MCHHRKGIDSSGTKRNRINSRAFLATCAITWRFIQLPVTVTYAPDYIVTHVCLSSTTQYSGVEYVRLIVSWNEEK